MTYDNQDYKTRADTQARLRLARRTLSIVGELISLDDRATAATVLSTLDATLAPVKQLINQPKPDMIFLRPRSVEGMDDAVMDLESAVRACAEVKDWSNVFDAPAQSNQSADPADDQPKCSCVGVNGAKATETKDDAEAGSALPSLRAMRRARTATHFRRA